MDVLQPHPAGYLLVEGDDAAAVRLLYAQGLHDFRDAVGGRGVGRQLSYGRFSQGDAFPAAFVAVGLCPSGCLETCIVDLAVVDAGQGDCGGTCEPRLVGADACVRSVVVGYFELDEQTGFAEGSDVVARGAVEAVAQECAEGVASLLHLVRHVVAQVEHAIGCELRVEGNAALVETLACGVVREVGHQVVVADAMAVDVELEVASGRDVGLCLRYLPAHAERLAEHRRTLCLSGRNPACVPVAGAEQAHRPVRHGAPLGAFAVRVPRLYAPVAVLSRGELASAVGDQRALVRRHTSAVPQVVVASPESFLRRSHHDAVSRLSLPADAFVLRFVDPRQTRLRHVHHAGFQVVLHAQGTDLQGCGPGADGLRQQQQREPKYLLLHVSSPGLYGSGIRHSLQSYGFFAFLPNFCHILCPNPAK